LRIWTLEWARLRVLLGYLNRQHCRRESCKQKALGRETQPATELAVPARHSPGMVRMRKMLAPGLPN
jgi:hypothetical protein